MESRENKSKKFIIIGIIFCVLVILWQEIFKQNPISSTVVYVDNKNVEEDTISSDEIIDEKININFSNESDFQKLPGIGKTVAVRIIEKRNEIGKFENIEDLKMVKGIGNKKFEEIKDLICI